MNMKRFCPVPAKSPLSIFFAASAFLAFFSASVLALTVERFEPQSRNMKILAGSDPVVISFRAEGRQLRFKWELDGPGSLRGASEQSNTALYVPPESVDSDCDTAIVSFAALDYEDNQFNESVIFSISAGSVGHSAPSAPKIEKNPAAGGTVVRIVSPAPESLVSGTAMVAGSFDESVREDIWVLVWPEKARARGWPQSDAAAVGRPALKKDGQWSVQCHFGGPPQSYEIAVYTAGAKASKFIRDRLVHWALTDRYEGILDTGLPDGLVERHRIRVVKK